MEYLFLPSWSRAEVWGVSAIWGLFLAYHWPFWLAVIIGIAWVFACGVAQSMVERRR